MRIVSRADHRLHRSAAARSDGSRPRADSINVRYKCILHLTEVTHVGGPNPYTTTDEDCAEIVYIDHTHIHTVEKADTGDAERRKEEHRQRREATSAEP